MKRSLGTHELFVKLITIPEERGMLSVKPAINLVQFIAKSEPINIVLYGIEFKTKQEAKDWYNEVKKTFGKAS